MLTDDPFATMTGNGWRLNTLEGGPQDTALNVNRLDRTVAIGEGSTATGVNSFAQGLNVTAIAPGASAVGESTTASGNNSHAEGEATIASGPNSHAEGQVSIASGTGSHAEGIGTIASGTASHAEGSSTTASGLASHAEGSNSNAGGTASHAEGSSTANGIQSHAEGGSAALGNLSHSEGQSTFAIGNTSHAEGEGSVATGVSSHAEGKFTNASGDNSHAEGNVTIASGNSSHASGILSNALREGQWSHSSGEGGLILTSGEQTSLVTMTGETPGTFPSESVRLLLGSALGTGIGLLMLEDGKDYTFTVTASVGAVQPGPVRVGRGFIIYFNVRRDGISTITGSGIGQSFGDPSTNDWTLMATPNVPGIDLVFTTGAINSTAKVIAEVKFVEITY